MNFLTTPKDPHGFLWLVNLIRSEKDREVSLSAELAQKSQVRDPGIYLGSQKRYGCDAQPLKLDL